MANQKPRRWTASFLRELVMTGDARLAAGRAGVDHSEAWMRRLEEPHFARYWEAALRMREEFAANIGATGPSTAIGGPPPQRS